MREELEKIIDKEQSWVQHCINQGEMGEPITMEKPDTITADQFRESMGYLRQQVELKAQREANETYNMSIELFGVEN